MIRTIKWEKENIEKICVCLFLFFAAFFFLTKSPLHFWVGGDAGTDSSVFKTVAMMMSKGYMPYRDSFDHKGPLIFLINFFGMKIAAYRGAWVFELAALFIAFTALYKIARLFCGRVLSCVVLLASTRLLFDYYAEGNLVEEYAMPFLAVSLYIYLDYLINRKVTKFRLTICGFGLGAICMLRPNMFSVWVVFSIAVLIDCIRKKQGKDIRNFLLFFLLGFCIMVFPIMIWLACNHAFGAFVEDYILFNFAYTAAGTGMKWYSFFYYFQTKEILISTVIVIYLLFKRENKLLYGAYLVYLVSTVLLMCMAGRRAPHYGMVFIPMFVFPIAELLSMFGSDSNAKSLRLVVSLYLLSIALPSWMNLMGGMMNLYEDRNVDHHTELVRAVCQVIEDNTTEEDRISVCGSWDIIYLMSDRMHATKYSYLFPVGRMVPGILEEYFEQLREELPKIIVVPEGWHDSQSSAAIYSFLEEYQYKEIWLREDPSGDIKIYLRE